MLELFDWLGTIFVIFGALLITSRKAENPKIRIYALIAYVVTCSCFFMMGYIIGALGMMINQTVLIIINFRGIINCFREIKNEDERQGFSSNTT